MKVYFSIYIFLIFLTSSCTSHKDYHVNENFIAEYVELVDTFMFKIKQLELDNCASFEQNLLKDSETLQHKIYQDENIVTLSFSKEKDDLFCDGILSLQPNDLQDPYIINLFHGKSIKYEMLEIFSKRGIAYEAVYHIYDKNVLGLAKYKGDLRITSFANGYSATQEETLNNKDNVNLTVLIPKTMIR